jgi:hypothetical protein
MALTSTTLAGAISATDLALPVAAVTGFVVGQPVMVDSEIIGGVVSVVGSSLNVRTRGDAGSAAIAHANLSLVVTGPVAELPPLPNPYAVPTRLTIDADATITVDPMAVNPITYVIMKGSAAALILAAPTKAQNGLRVTFRSGTAFAHVITYAAGFYGDTTGSDTATWAAKIGASATFEANNGTWGVLALGNVVVA